MLFRSVDDDFPQHEIIINGGIKTLQDCLQHLQQVDGVMLGREPYHNPFLLQQVDRLIFAQPQAEMPTRLDMLRRGYPYIEQQLAQGIPLTHMSRHLSGLFNGQPNARRWRRFLGENARRENAGTEVLREAEQLLG